MFCPKCLQEVPPSSTTCPFCGHNLTPGELLSAPPGARAIPPPPPPVPTVKRSWLDSVPAGLLNAFSILGAMLVLAMGYYKARIWSHGVFNAEANGYFMGSLLMPTIIAWLIVWLSTRKRNPPMPGAQKGAMGVSIALLVCFISLAGELGSAYRTSTEDETKQRIARLAKEGTGQAPKSADEGRFDEIIRPFFADIKKFNDDYTTESSALDNSAITPLYGAKTFDSDHNISKAIEQLRAMDAVEAKYASLDPLLQKTKERLFASSLSDSEKKAFWDNFEVSFRKSVKPRDDVNASERVWLKDSISLYEFMQANEESFRVKDNQLIFASTDLLNEYNERFRKVDGERKAFLETKHKFEEQQKEGLGQMGLQPSDFNTPGSK